MGETRRRNRLIGAAALVVVAVAVLAANYLGVISPEPGPLHGPGNATGITVDGRTTVTAIFVLHDAETSAEFELRSAEVVGADEPLSVGAARVLECPEDEVCSGPHFSRSWPPRGALTRAVDGYAIEADVPTLVGVPVEVPEGPGSYSVRGLEVRYSQGLRRYRAEVGPNLIFVVRD